MKTFGDFRVNSDVLSRHILPKVVCVESRICLRKIGQSVESITCQDLELTLEGVGKVDPHWCQVEIHGWRKQ